MRLLVINERGVRRRQAVQTEVVPMLAIKRFPVYAWLLAAIVVLALALMFFDLPILGWAVLIVYLLGWAIREMRAR